MELPKRYHPALVTLHWLMALLVFVNLYLGMVTFENREGGPGGNSFVGLHMFVGVLLIVLLVARIILRMRTAHPAEATAGNKLLDLLARIIHYGLYVVVLAVTVIGLVFSLQSGRFQSTFLGAESRFGPPTDGQGLPGARLTPPAGGEVSPPANGEMPGFPGGPGGRGGPGGMFGLLIVHEMAAYALLSLVILHIGAALYHQFIRKDNLIPRMWYGRG